MPFGILDTQYIDLPAGIDAAYIEGLRTAAGVDFPQVLREIDSRIAALNTNLDPLVAALISTTTEQYADTTGPAAFKIEKKGEYTLARPQLAAGSAHMLPLDNWNASMEFTEDGLERLSLSRILANVDSLFNGYRLLYRTQALKRLFDDAVWRVDAATTSTSPGFAGSGTGDNAWTRPYPGGQALPDGYTHYYRDSTANRAAVIKSARNRLKKWYGGPYDLIASADEVTAIQALSGYVDAGSALVRLGTGSAEALVDPMLYVGVYDGDIRVRKPLDDFTDANIAIFKSFGPLAAGNPLAWRYDDKAPKGRSAYVRSRSLYPLDQAIVLQRFGIGVGNRVAAVLIHIAASGNYAAPTFLADAE